MLPDSGGAVNRRRSKLPEPICLEGLFSAHNKGENHNFAAGSISCRKLKKVDCNADFSNGTEKALV